MSHSKPETNYLTPLEDAILRSYFGIPLDKAQAGLDFWEADGNESIHLEEGLDSDHDDDRAICNAVARLLLAAVQDRLPNWSAIRSDGEFVTTREKRTYGVNRVAFLPIHLFTINWADSGPGFSWPEEYRAIWVPGFERYVVTASRDTAEGYGYADEAIGWFAGDGDLRNDSLEVIKAHWEEQYFQYEQHRWVYILDDGLITAPEANLLADEVWGDDEDGEEDETDEETGDETEEDEAKDEETVAIDDDVGTGSRLHAVPVSTRTENPVVLRVSKHLSFNIHYDDLIKAYCELGSVEISIGYSYVTGLGQMYRTAGIAECAPVYCKKFYEDNGFFPIGVHEIPGKVSQTPGVFKFKFPDTAPVVSNGGNTRLITGPACYLERDWYLHGTRVHRINPDDPLEVILRAPVRDELDARSVSLAIEFLAHAQKHGTLGVKALLPLLDGLQQKIESSAESVRVKCGYSPNLAELWRKSESLGHGLNPLIEFVCSQ